MNGLALCAGAGGLELGLRIAIRDYRTVCYVEREAYAASVLVARMEDASLDRAPIWDDIKTFDGKPWRGKVDIISAGYPCQPFSVAGQRGGEADERYIWPDNHRIISEARPWLVWLENVPGHLVLGFDRTLADLTALGFDSEWDTFRASDCGAPQRRERLFCLAYASGKRRQQVTGSSYGDEGSNEGRTPKNDNKFERDEQGMAHSRHSEHAGRDKGEGRDEGGEQSRNEPSSSDSTMAESSIARSGGLAGKQGEGLSDTDGRSKELADSQDSDRWAREPEVESEKRERRWRPFPPGPGDINAWEEIDPTLKPARSKEEAESQFRRMADELADRLDGGLGYAEKIRSDKVLWCLWEKTVQKANQRKARRLWRIQSEKILRQGMYGNKSTEGRSYQRRISETSLSFEEECMRGLRNLAEIADSSCRQELAQQYAQEYHHLMPDLPYETSLEGWRYNPNQNWVDRLRACGNGVVPVCAALAFTTLWERLND